MDLIDGHVRWLEIKKQRRENREETGRGGRRTAGNVGNTQDHLRLPLVVVSYPLDLCHPLLPLLLPLSLPLLPFPLQLGLQVLALRRPIGALLAKAGQLLLQFDGQLLRLLEQRDRLRRSPWNALLSQSTLVRGLTFTSICLLWSEVSCRRVWFSSCSLSDTDSRSWTCRGRDELKRRWWTVKHKVSRNRLYLLLCLLQSVLVATNCRLQQAQDVSRKTLFPIMPCRKTAACRRTHTYTSSEKCPANMWSFTTGELLVKCLPELESLFCWSISLIFCRQFTWASSVSDCLLAA